MTPEDQVTELKRARRQMLWVFFWVLGIAFLR